MMHKTNICLLGTLNIISDKTYSLQDVKLNSDNALLPIRDSYTENEIRAQWERGLNETERKALIKYPLRRVQYELRFQNYLRAFEDLNLVVRSC
jgi:hypothetical protein